MYVFGLYALPGTHLLKARRAGGESFVKIFGLLSSNNSRVMKMKGVSFVTHNKALSTTPEFVSVR